MFAFRIGVANRKEMLPRSGEQKQRRNDCCENHSATDVLSVLEQIDSVIANAQFAAGCVKLEKKIVRGPDPAFRIGRDRLHGPAHISGTNAAIAAQQQAWQQNRAVNEVETAHVRKVQSVARSSHSETSRHPSFCLSEGRTGKLWADVIRPGHTLARSCALIVPCYNEAARLDVGEYAAFLRVAPEGFHIVFVDDGSSDETLAVLHEIQRLAGNAAVVLEKRPNGGKADAVRQGLNFALDNMQPQVVGFWDADLATPLPAVYDLLAILEEIPQTEMIFGARVQLLGRRVDRKASRHYLGRMFATVVSNVLALPVYDTQCGAKLFRATPALRDVLREPFLSRWIFDVEIIARFVRMLGVAWVANAIYEFPLKRWQDVDGSKVKPGDFLKAIGEIFGIWNRYLRDASGTRMPRPAVPARTPSEGRPSRKPTA